MSIKCSTMYVDTETERNGSLKHLTLTEAAAYLNVHRSTINRLASSGALPADSYTTGGRRGWLASTLDTHRIGVGRETTCAYISSKVVPELSVTLLRGQTLMGHRAVRTHLSEKDRAQAYASLLTHLTDVTPGLLILPAEHSAHHGHRTVTDLCASLGILVLLLPT